MTTETSQASNHARWAVLLLAHGAPDRLGDIPQFLLNVRGGRPLPETAVEEIIERYARIGGGSPLLKLTQQQARALSDAMRLPVYVGMRNWKPYIAEAVQQIQQDGVERAIALCLAPQNSRTSIGLYRSHLEAALEKSGAQFRVDFIESWHDDPGLIAAFREKISKALDEAQSKEHRRLPVIFTAHSVPAKTVEAGDPYEDQVKETARLVAESMNLSDYRVAFQSQGMTADPWIGPTVESQIDELAAEGHRRILLAPVGFVSDHVEILFDIDVVFREYGEKKGVLVTRSESLNDSPLFIRALADIIGARIGRTASARHS